MPSARRPGSTVSGSTSTTTQQVPLDDEATFRLIRTTHTLGCFQIESPGQRELIGKFGPERFEDLIIDISLFRPGPVKSDMIVPFLEARHGWKAVEYLHPTLVPALEETAGVVVFHEQVLKIVAETTGVTLAEADEVRRAMGTPQGQIEVEAWWRPAAAARGYAPADVERIWEVLKSFASFGFCKAHAAAFALPTYHSAWLKTHHPAAFLAGVLTHDPGMYPKRLILDDARSLGIAVLGLDVNTSSGTYQVERVEPWEEPPPRILDQDHSREAPAHPDLPDARAYGIRLSLADVKGISEAEVARIVAGQPYFSLADFWNRARVSRPVVERLVLAGGFDSLYGMAASDQRARPAWPGDPARPAAARRELDRWSRSVARSSRRVSPRRSRAGRGGQRPGPGPGPGPSGVAAAGVAPGGPGGRVPDLRGPGGLVLDVRGLAAAQSQAAQPVLSAAQQPTQLALDLGDSPELAVGTGLPEMTGPERVRAELDILGLDASAHVVDFYAPMLRALGVTRSRDLPAAAAARRSGSAGSRWPPRPRRSARAAGWCS